MEKIVLESEKEQKEYVDKIIKFDRDALYAIESVSKNIIIIIISLLTLVIGLSLFLKF